MFILARIAKAVAGMDPRIVLPSAGLGQSSLPYQNTRPDRRNRTDTWEEIGSIDPLRLAKQVECRLGIALGLSQQRQRDAPPPYLLRQ